LDVCSTAKIHSVTAVAICLCVNPLTAPLGDVNKTGPGKGKWFQGNFQHNV
jgi:hypothetical protein